MPELFAYTDGACSGNPGPGGWGVLLRALEDGAVVKERELKGGEAATTNNRMELLAAIPALEVACAAFGPHRRHRQRLCEERRDGLDPWLEAQWLEDRRPQAGQERGTLAAARRGAEAAPGDLEMDQGSCRPCRERARGRTGAGRDEAFQAGQGSGVSLLALLDLAAVLVFALTGALVASRAQLDIVGFAFLACLTGMGGGTLRDLLLDRTVFWLADPRPLAVASGAALVVFFTAHLLESRYRAILWLDAAALSVAVAAGSGIALSLGQPAPIVLVMGIATGTFGGLMRDVVANEVPLVLKQGELYVTCALAGSLAAVLMPDGAGAAVACALVTFGLRAGSIALGWRLPVYRARPPR